MPFDGQYIIRSRDAAVDSEKTRLVQIARKTTYSVR